jgi:hypothetical protein
MELMRRRGLWQLGLAQGTDLRISHRPVRSSLADGRRSSPNTVVRVALEDRSVPFGGGALPGFETVRVRFGSLPALLDRTQATHAG